MAELYSKGSDQIVPDDVWIADVSARGWVALTKDTSVIRHHHEALAASTLRVFALDNASITGDEMARRFQVNLHRILQRVRKLGPYVDVVHKDRVERRWPSTAAGGGPSGDRRRDGGEKVRSADG